MLRCVLLLSKQNKHFEAVNIFDQLDPNKYMQICPPYIYFFTRVVSLMIYLLIISSFLFPASPWDNKSAQTVPSRVSGFQLRLIVFRLVLLSKQRAFWGGLNFRPIGVPLSGTFDGSDDPDLSGPCALVSGASASLLTVSGVGGSPLPLLSSLLAVVIGIIVAVISVVISIVISNRTTISIII